MEEFLLIFMAVLLLGWVVFCGGLFIKEFQATFVMKGTSACVKCEKCGAEYQVSAREFASSHFAKYISVTKTRRKGIALAEEPKIKYYAKKFHCPACGEKCYARVLNTQDLVGAGREAGIKAGVKWLLLMVIGGGLIGSVMQIPISVVRQANVRKVNEMKEQRYQELKEKYDLNLD